MLVGERVTLRALAQADLPRLHEFNNDLDLQLLAEFNPPRPESLEQLQASFAERANSGSRGDIEFAIVADGQLIGLCELGAVHPAHGTASLTLFLGDSNYRGRGYGREVLRLLIDYAFRVRNIRKLWLSTNSENGPALRCYQACGFVEEGRQRQQQWLNGRYVDAVFMGLLREEWTVPSEPDDLPPDMPSRG